MKGPVSNMSADADAELATFVFDKLQTEIGRRELRVFLRDIADQMIDQHAVQAIAAAIAFVGVPEGAYDR